MNKHLISRRGWLAAAAAFTIVPRHVLGGPGFTPPSEKLNIGAVGVGGRGEGDLEGLKSENIVALCDVDWDRAAGSFKRFPGAKKYRDFREMLDREKGLDAVVVATPDHVHFHASMAAVERGKHVYCEKPLTHSVWEARALATAAGRQGVATQMGNQGQASEGARRLCEHLWDGAIGKVREVHQWTDRPLGWWPQGIDRPGDRPPVPSNLDWDLWLGPAPERPYHPAYHPFRWRGWWDFGTGALGDIGCHAFDPIFKALRLGPPVSVEASSTKRFPETAPLASIVTYRFPSMKLVWYDGGLKPALPDAVDEDLSLDKGGVFFVGEKGVIMNDRLYPKSLRDAYEPPPKVLRRSPGHHREWIEACKGGVPAGSRFELSGPLTEAVLLGNIAVRTGRKILWDPKDLKIPNLPEAEPYLKRSYREGWKI